MNKFLVAALAAITMTAVAVAGGDYKKVKEPVPVEVIDNSSFYVGIGYGFGTASATDGGYNDFGHTITVLDEQTMDNITFQAGYNINEFVAVEGRYNYGIDQDIGYGTDISLDTFAVYVKPQYPITPEVSVYGLLGYAWNTGYQTGEADYDFDGFAYGVGAKYAVAENVEVFADYTSVYDDNDILEYDTFTIDSDREVYNVTVGVTYKF